MQPVTITLHGSLSSLTPSGERTVRLELREPSGAMALLLGLGLPDGTVSMLYVNGRRVTADHPVYPGDLVEAFPMLCGG